ncbi:hypothetical protein Ddye_016749 [Dipteronia dyeriana]|uniref:Reverse transcriptase zinc-binding domain-containing protein n=1 Tax=Dipteronia dyeriana TaxID=168575 RepID=A0AAD9X0V1_9ROSI|nr:hypothetical protein Ddye_016749 [Dipteronia dyeriana]
MVEPWMSGGPVVEWWVTKVNTDGAALSSPGVEGCEGVFRNCIAFVNGCFAVALDHVFAFEAELLAASMAMNFAWQNGWCRIWLESDYSYVVQLPSSRFEQVPWQIWQAWQRCIYQISKLKFQWKSLWKLNIPPKVRIFILRACLNAIPSRENLWRKKVVPAPCCDRCVSHVESSSHALFSCKAARLIWQETRFGSLVANLRNHSVMDVLLNLADQCEGDDFSLVCMVAWAIWEDHNSR